MKSFNWTAAILATMVTCAAMSFFAVSKSPPDEEMDYGRTCLALAAFSEARSESDDAMYEVAAVALRRSMDEHDRWPKTICDVTEEPDQFAGVTNWGYPRWPWKLDRESWNRALLAADKVIDRGGKSKQCDGALFFHQRGNDKVPNFKCRVGSLYFYGDML